VLVGELSTCWEPLVPGVWAKARLAGNVEDWVGGGGCPGTEALESVGWCEMPACYCRQEHGGLGGWWCMVVGG
jgi:hypothetical protein